MSENLALGISNNLEIVSMIGDKIREQKSSNLYSEDDLLLIFDLIQAWGGKMGRHPYVKPKCNISRNSPGYACKYRKAIIAAEEGEDYNEVLDKFCGMKQVGPSFATKHMYFWSKYNDRIDKKFLIYDAWMKKFFRIICERELSYECYLEKMEQEEDRVKISIFSVETGLFTFLNSYFDKCKFEKIKESARNKGKNREAACLLIKWSRC